MNQLYAVCVIPMEDSRVVRISWFSVSKVEERSRRMMSEPNLEQVELCTWLSICISAFICISTFIFNISTLVFI